MLQAKPGFKFSGITYQTHILSFSKEIQNMVIPTLGSLQNGKNYARTMQDIQLRTTYQAKEPIGR